MAAFVSASAVTLYAVLATPMMAIRQWNSMVLMATMPAVASAHAARDRSFVESLVIRGSRFNLLLIGGLLVSAAALASPALRVWMGSEYAKYAGLCRILLLSYFLTVPFSLILNVLMGLGQVRMLGTFALSVAVVSIATTVVLLMRVGFSGVVYANLLRNFISNRGASKEIPINRCED